MLLVAAKQRWALLNRPLQETISFRIECGSYFFFFFFKEKRMKIQVRKELHVLSDSRTRKCY